MNIEPVQIAAYVADLVLVACAWRFPRTRWYVATHLALDLTRLHLALVPCGPRPFVGVDYALLLLDGTLLLLPSIALAVAMSLDWRAITGLVAGTMVLVAVAYPNVQGEALERCYVASMASARLYMVVAPIASRKWRRCAVVGDYVLLALAATGLVGAVVSLAWPGHWTLVNCGNVAAHLTLGVLCLLAHRRNHVE